MLVFINPLIAIKTLSTERPFGQRYFGKTVSDFRFRTENRQTCRVVQRWCRMTHCSRKWTNIGKLSGKTDWNKIVVNILLLTICHKMYSWILKLFLLLVAFKHLLYRIELHFLCFCFFLLRLWSCLLALTLFVQQLKLGEERKLLYNCSFFF